MREDAPILTVPAARDAERVSDEVARDVTAGLEAGQVVFFPDLTFTCPSLDTLLAQASSAATAKNVSYDPNTGVMRGVREDVGVAAQMHDAMAAFAAFSRTVLLRYAPRYRDGLVVGRTSFRPAQIAGRQTSWRKDDTRLHVDSFPSTPVHGRRILRFFANVNPRGEPRCWRIGAPFTETAQRFLPRLRTPFPGTGTVLRALHVTRSKRTLYDAYMLQLHDCMKRDADYQQQPGHAYDFPAGTCWMVYTDLVAHAAMSGQHAFEQTFYLPVAHMQDPARSPLRVLERLTEKALV